LSHFIKQTHNTSHKFTSKNRRVKNATARKEGGEFIERIFRITLRKEAKVSLPSFDKITEESDRSNYCTFQKANSLSAGAQIYHSK
jgi:hypothetical protein